jgi:hypothetical protein
VHVNGKNIENRTISGKKLKNHTIAGKKLKNNTLGGKQINEGKLGTVPQAESATQAGSATRAATATTATRAAIATTATTATSAASADNAAALGGDPPSAFLVSCPPATTLYGGVCWDNGSRSAAGWFTASDTCGNAGGRLPTLSELVAYTDQPDTQVTAGHWSSEVVDPAAGTPIVAVRDEASHFFTGSGTFVYRCVFYRTN